MGVSRPAGSPSPDGWVFMQVTPPDVPYEKQVDEWTCGAASLCSTFATPGNCAAAWAAAAAPRTSRCTSPSLEAAATALRGAGLAVATHLIPDIGHEIDGRALGFGRNALAERFAAA